MFSSHAFDIDEPWCLAGQWWVFSRSADVRLHSIEVEEVGNCPICAYGPVLIPDFLVSFGVNRKRSTRDASYLQNEKYMQRVECSLADLVRFVIYCLSQFGIILDHYRALVAVIIRATTEELIQLFTLNKN